MKKAINTRSTMQWMGAAALVAAGGLVGCASGNGMSGTYGTSGAGGTAGAVNSPAGSTAAATDTTAVRVTNPTSANAKAYPNTAGGAANLSFANLGSDAYIASALDVANSDEIAAGMLARDRAQNPALRSFANRMVADHTKMQTQDRAFMASSASDSAGVTRQMRNQDNAAMAQLRGAAGSAQFDSLYLNQQVEAHRMTLALLNAARDQAQDAKLRDVINGAIPQVQSHLDQATSLQRTLRSGTSGP